MSGNVQQQTPFPFHPLLDLSAPLLDDGLFFFFKSLSSLGAAEKAAGVSPCLYCALKLLRSERGCDVDQGSL